MIRFEVLEGATSPKEKTKLKSWLKEVAALEKCSIGELTYIFCTDVYLLSINQEYLKHDTYTDIITFDYSEGGLTLEGDIYISTERVAENALKYDAAFDEELRRVMVHGLLHLMGYKDKSDKQSQQMRAKENESLELFRK
jgi:probable rRNA maturation factor